ncbi:uncharacterized protein LOC113767895 [Coffea eugenioides]|uniref:Avr9/Cf-9 rapidly elicited protein 146 n=1 Tax=Coffea arabica TaxID=13443 RepID=A0A6P6SVX7_COFAR|nr:uncharacterized protein LOC113695084 [Coffea arabica]XP_027167901.1 uncharacterized protein LOC113767895 [Coffea eugenioides]
MEIEPSSPPLIAKKLWNIVRIVFYMLKKGITKSKLMHDLHMMFKRGKLAGKAINNLVLHLQEDYTNSLTCRSTDVRMSIVHPREYEFSCSNSPAYPTYFSKRRNHHHHHHHHHGYSYKPQDIHVVQKVFDVLNHYDKVEASPMVLPGFGHSPTVRQLRVTDSPFPVKDNEENPQVDKDAEEFIKKFYKDLKQQRRVAALDSPSPYHIWARAR